MGAQRGSERLEVLLTGDGRVLIERAVEAPGTSITEFVVSTLTVEAQRVLAGRAEFVLDADAAEAWEEINRRSARDLPGIRRLMERPTPFTAD